MSNPRSAIIWSAIDTFWRQGMTFAISVVLARLLTPEEFGTVALLSLFIALAGVLADAGFSQALIQRKDLTATDESTVFWFNMGAGVLLALILCLIAPFFASAYGVPALQVLTYVMAANVFLAAAGAVQQALMTKRLDFRLLTRINVISTILSGMVAIVLAWQGAGVWALASQSIVANIAITSMLWLFNGWRPDFTFSRGSFRSLFGFGGYLFAAKILDTGYQRGTSLLVGSLYGLANLGLYQRAARTQDLPVGMINHLVSRVMFPVMSAANDDPDLLRSIAARSIRQIMFITVPLMIGLSVVADLFIGVIFGDQWLGAVPILTILCFVGVMRPLHMANRILLKSLGHAGLLFRLEVVTKSIGIGAIIAGSFMGIVGIAWAVVSVTAVAVVLNGLYVGRYLGFTLLHQLKHCAVTLLCGGLMAGVILALRPILALDGAAGLAAFVGIGGVTYLVSHLLLGRATIVETIKLVRGTAS